MKIFTFGIILFSQFALAQQCLVDMVSRTNRVIQTFRSYDAHNACKEGMKECRLTIRTAPHLGGVDCVRRNSQPIPNPYPTPDPYPTYYPTPNPYPTPIPYPTHDPYPNPYPYPGGSMGYPTNIINGETVFNVSNSRFAQVVAQDYSGKFVLRYQDNGATGTGWDRRDLAPLRGCDFDLCVNDQVYNVSNSRYATVIGLQMIEKFVLRYSDNSAVGSGWDRDDLAVMKGCQSGLCVGTKVINVSNRRYATVQALQSGNRFVLRYEDNGATGSGWDIRDLAPIMGGFNF
jgi:predicted secreted protein